MRSTISIALVLVGCASVYARPAAYSAELEECSRTASSLCASVYCEQGVRVRYGRPLREWPASCHDGGVTR